MALRWSNEAQSAVTVLVVVPLHELFGPASGGGEIGEPGCGIAWPVLGGTEQRFDEGVVVADPRTRVGRRDAQPLQHSQHRRGLQRGAVVAV